MPKDVWIIDVCRTCGKLANWPFCEHKENNGTWFERVKVTGTWHPRESHGSRA